MKPSAYCFNQSMIKVESCLTSGLIRHLQIALDNL